VSERTAVDRGKARSEDAIEITTGSGRRHRLPDHVSGRSAAGGSLLGEIDAVPKVRVLLDGIVGRAAVDRRGAGLRAGEALPSPFRALGAGPIPSRVYVRHLEAVHV
jgi:hypothetical protein